MDGLTEIRAGSADDLQSLLEFLYLCPHGLAELDGVGQVAMMNPACLRLLMPLAGAKGGITNLFDALSPYAPDLRTRLAEASAPRGLVLDGLRVHVGKLALPAVRKRSASTGNDEPLVLALTLLRLSPDRLMAVLSDISRQVAGERRLREAEAWFTAVAQGGEDYAYFSLDAEGRIADWNLSCERLFGLLERQAIGCDGRDVLTPIEGGKEYLAGRLANARAAGWHVAGGRLPRASGEHFWSTSVVSVMRGDEEQGEPEAYLVVVRNTTDQHASVEALRAALCTDHLTGVLNRRHFFELAEAACRDVVQKGGRLSAIMVDADRFKAVNDSLGHAAGDAVLTALAATLQHGARAGADLVARLGGEEFCVLLPGLGVAEAARVAERLRAAIAEQTIGVPHSEGTARSIQVTASFGVAGLHADASDLEGVLRAADAALYRAKANGRNRVEVANK